MSVQWISVSKIKLYLIIKLAPSYFQERPHTVIWSDTVKRVIIVELTVPWEENMEETFWGKKFRYENLRMECEDKGWARQVMPIQVGCRGFISLTTTSYMTRLRPTNRARRRATRQHQTAAERASSWIWSKVRKSTTAWQIAFLPLSFLTPTNPPTPTPPPPPPPPHPQPYPQPPQHHHHHLHPYPIECIQNIPQTGDIWESPGVEDDR